MTGVTESPSDHGIDLSLYPDSARLNEQGGLEIGGCSIEELAEQYGTPAYLIDEGSLRRQARSYLNAFRSRHANSLVLFASKCFPSASVIGVTAEEGCGADVAAEGELRLAMLGGADPTKAVLHGNAKTDTDIWAAIEARVRYIVIDNLDDVERIARIGAELDAPPVPTLLRVSPSINAATHEAMATGHDASKFGIPTAQIDDAIATIRQERRIELRGLHAHVGSQLLDLDQFQQEVEALAQHEHFPVYDLGGGLGVRYVSSDAAPSVDEYAEVLVSAAHKYLGTDIELLVEPGRSMVARAGVTVYRVVTVKRGVVTHAAVDGGMGDNMEVALYGQPFEPAIVGRDGDREVVNVVGRHCESGDRIATQVSIVSPRVGDLLAVPVTGAYCYTMSNNFNTALRPPVVFCDEGRSRLAVRRETFDDLVRREQLIDAQ
jgi:diaminopimelate decarboxylase